MMIKKYRKKPVVIEAVKFEYSIHGIEVVTNFCGDSLGDHGKCRHIGAKGWAHIRTLEDGNNIIKHIATEGDMIIKGVNGEFYPCKPDIFEKTYDPE